MRKAVLLLVPVFFLLMSQPAWPLNIGTGRTVMNTGDIAAGQEKIIDFYLISDYDKDLIVDLIEAEPNLNDYVAGLGRYDLDISQLSEESALGWTKPIADMPPSSLIIGPDKQLYYPKYAGPVVANRKFDAILKVPADAEPGYHMDSLIPSPRFSAQVGGIGVGIITVTKLGYIFNVAGSAVRSGEILGLSASRAGERTASIDVIFKNTGTVTMSAKAEAVEVYGGSGEPVATLSTDYQKLAPGQIATFRVIWDNMAGKGNYKVIAKVSWVSGKIQKESTVSVGDYVPPSITGQAVVPPPAQIPLWILPLGIIIFALVIYSRKK